MIGLDSRDRLVEGRALPPNIRLLQRRIEGPQLGDQSRPGTLVNGVPRGRCLLCQAFDGPCNEWVIICHFLGNDPERPCRQPSKGFFMRIVSSRSGEVDSTATGAPISSSMRRTYLTA